MRIHPLEIWVLVAAGVCSFIVCVGVSYGYWLYLKQNGYLEQWWGDLKAILDGMLS